MKITKITIGKGSCGIAAGADAVEKLLFEEIYSNVDIVSVGCVGLCQCEPLVDVFFEDNGKVEKRTFKNVGEKEARELAKFVNGRKNNVEKFELDEENAAQLVKQTRVALRNCGLVNPENIDEYIANGGYEAAKTCVANGSNWIINEIKTSELAGRGGAGFPTWFKWNAAKEADGEEKFVICNADEGDPGAFMDRAILEGDPHSVIEGMLIAALAIGAKRGFVYVRAEYPLAVRRLNTAIAQARENGFLGDGLFGTDFSFDLRVKQGAGAFVCGEETALIASIEGQRGMPRLKPPFPAQKGFEGKPTNINNVETFANVPAIIQMGGAKFAEIGEGSSKGTKVFALTGKIKKGGLVEVPMGVPLSEVIYGFGGGTADGNEVKAVQLGGPSGGCIPKTLFDTPIGYKELAATGAIMGSGGMVVMDESTCMVEMARFFLDFTRKESCGKCTQCRIGSMRMLEVLERIVNGKGAQGDIEQLEDLGRLMKEGALCGLGQTAPNPVLTTLKYYREEFEEHIVGKKCRAKACKALLKYAINEKCVKCGLCAKKCPTNAIFGDKESGYVIDVEKCVKCGQCKAVCKFGAAEAE